MKALIKNRKGKERSSQPTPTHSVYMGTFHCSVSTMSVLLSVDSLPGKNIQVIWFEDVCRFRQDWVNKCPAEITLFDVGEVILRLCTGIRFVVCEDSAQWSVNIFS